MSSVGDKLLVTNAFNSILSLPSMCYGLVTRAKKAPTLDTGILIDSDSCIVLIHGRNDAPTQFTALIGPIRQASPLSNVIAVCLPDGDSSIEEDAINVMTQLDVALESLTSKHTAFRVTLIGVSKGGLTAAHLAATNNLAKYVVDKLITIASPLHGVVAANYAFWTIHTQRNLSEGSEVTTNTTEALAALVAANKLLVYNVVLWFDSIIVPNSSASYSFASDVHIQSTFTAHPVVQNHPDVIQKVIQWL